MRESQNFTGESSQERKMEVRVITVLVTYIKSSTEKNNLLLFGARDFMFAATIQLHYKNDSFVLSKAANRFKKIRINSKKLLLFS